MIVITGAAGFIGSYMASFLNRQGVQDLLLVDDFGRTDKDLNQTGKSFAFRIDRELFFPWIEKQDLPVTGFLHLGARTDTTSQDRSSFDHLNYNYSRKVWRFCAERNIPLVYASSAATYGDGSQGFSDDASLVRSLRPLNPYAESKHRFDLWALEQQQAPPHWCGLKFFNVYGPNEYHKGRMASVIFHTFQQIRQTGKMKLFRSHRIDFADGEQSRDFIYVRDVARVCQWMLEHRPGSGLYNLGTGVARTFFDLASNTFRAMGLEPQIEFIDMPEDIRDAYQYYTCADMGKLHRAGYGEPMATLEEGIADYVQNFLMKGAYF